MEPDALYYLFDISEAKSLEAGLQLTGRRTERDMGKSIKSVHSSSDGAFCLYR